MMVPPSGPDLHEAHSALNQPPGDEQLPSLRRASVQVADVLRFLGEVESVGGFQLHPIRHLVGLDTRFKLRVFLQVAAVKRVQLLHQVELPPLFLLREILVTDVLDHSFNGVGLGVDARGLKVSRQKRRTPIQRAAGRRTAGPQRDVTRHVLVFASQPVERPGAQARFGHPQ